MSWCAINKPKPVDESPDRNSWCAVNDGSHKFNSLQPIRSPKLPEAVSTPSLKRKATEEPHEQSSWRAISKDRSKSGTPTPILSNDLLRPAHKTSPKSKATETPLQRPPWRTASYNRSRSKTSNHVLPNDLLESGPASFNKHNPTGESADKQKDEIPAIVDDETGSDSGSPLGSDESESDSDDETAVAATVLNDRIKSMEAGRDSDKIELNCGSSPHIHLPCSHTHIFYRRSTREDTDTP